MEHPPITPVTDEVDIVYPPQAVVDTALVNSVEAYQAMYDESIKDPEAFWVRMMGSKIPSLFVDGGLRCVGGGAGRAGVGEFPLGDQVGARSRLQFRSQQGSHLC
jgi:hypothetical protein